MFCSNCGTKLRDNAKFCNKCGCATESAELNESPRINRLDRSLSEVNPYIRDVTLLHLYDLRTLEMEREKLRVNINDLDYKIKNLGLLGYYEKPVYQGDYSVLGFVAFGVVASLVFFFLGGFLDSIVGVIFNGFSFFDGIGNFLGIAAVIISVIALIYFFYDNARTRKEYRRDVENYNNSLAYDAERVEKEKVEKQRLQEIRNQVYDEWQIADKLLAKAYDVNIIPSQFRNIYAIYYLYDYLSTSQESLSEALLHLDLDEIKQKLDTIIIQNREMILELARTNAQLAELNEKQNETIALAIKAEKNTSRAAQYAQISAVHEEAQLHVLEAQYWHLNEYL